MISFRPLQVTCWRGEGIVGTLLFMRGFLDEGRLHARPINEPKLSLKLYMCEQADRPAALVLGAV